MAIGALNIVGNSDVALLRHSEGVALQTDDGALTMECSLHRGLRFAS